MKQLRTGSARPELLVDSNGVIVGEPTGLSTVGLDGPLGSERVVYALPINGVDLPPMKLLHDHDGALIGDADGTLIGMDRVWISRLLTAAPTTNTRRLR